MWVDMFPMDMPAPGPAIDISPRKPKRWVREETAILSLQKSKKDIYIYIYLIALELFSAD